MSALTGQRNLLQHPGRVFPRRAAVLGEFGGLGLPLKGHTWQDEKNWGYVSYKGSDGLTSIIRQRRSGPTGVRALQWAPGSAANARLNVGKARCSSPWACSCSSSPCSTRTRRGRRPRRSCCWVSRCGSRSRSSSISTGGSGSNGFTGRNRQGGREFFFVGGPGGPGGPPGDFGGGGFRSGNGTGSNSTNSQADPSQAAQAAQARENAISSLVENQLIRLLEAKLGRPSG